jgi:hypothetical protein
MIRMGKESKLAPSEVIEKAVEFFGPSGVGMRILEQGDCFVRFDGAGGYVFAQAAAFDDRDGSDVTIEGREWEHQIRQFMGEI